MAIYPIIVHFSTWRVRSMHDMACEFARAVMRSKDAQKQLALTSLKLAGQATNIPQHQNYSVVSKNYWACDWWSQLFLNWRSL